MDYLPLSDNAARQVIDSTTVFDEFARVQAQARQYAGGMYWKRQQGYQYLVKTTPDNRQHRIGPHSPETERIFEEFSARKTQVEARLKSLKTALTDAERMNKALKAGRVPSMVVSVLQSIESVGLGEHFTVVGTHALYAYETAAGVRIVQGALATQDVDLLWDARRRVRFLSDLGRLDLSMLRVLQLADPTFQRKEGQNETAINARGFEVDFLRRQPEGDDPHPFRFSDDERDLWPVQARRASVLTNAPRFVDPLVVWLYTTLDSIPTILLLLSLALLMPTGKGMLTICLALGITSWVSTCRIVRGEVMRQREWPYVRAAKAVGVPSWRIAWKHMLPNLWHLILVQASLVFVYAVKSEVILSYLGVGIVDKPSWGVMIDDARLELVGRGAWWQFTGATAALFVLVLAFNLFSDALKEALDPR